MLANLGFYFVFLFKLALMGVLSLIMGYLYRKNEDSKTLKIYSVSSLIVVALVSVFENYASNNSEVLTFLFPTIFGILFILNYKESKQVLIKCILFFCVSIFIGLGYYISAITFVVILFLIEFLFDGIFDFFITDNKKENIDDFIDVEDEGIDIIDEE
tara:strand:+ start:412 stop:885 length:474 start_codon:yes stop_codon:yes gene_type:complete